MLEIINGIELSDINNGQADMKKTALQGIISRLEHKYQMCQDEDKKKAYSYAITLCKGFLPIEQQQIEDAYEKGGITHDADDGMEIIEDYSRKYYSSTYQTTTNEQ